MRLVNAVHMKRMTGSLLIGEMASVVILAVSIFALNELVNTTGVSSNQMSNTSHANWMAEDIYSRMVLRENLRLANAYTSDHTSLTCPGVSGSFSTVVSTRDLQRVFCSPNRADPQNISVFSGPAGFIPGLQWQVTCVGGAAGSCPNGSTIRVEISWPDNNSQAGAVNGRFTYSTERVITT